MQGPKNGDEMPPISRTILAVALIAVPGAVRAEELGRITAYLNGASTTWHTVTMQQGGRRVATASFAQGARLSELHVQGHPEPRFTTRDVFSVEVRYLGRYAPGAVPLSVDVMHMPDGMGGPFWTSRGAGTEPTVEINALEVWGNYGRLTAHFTAELCFLRIISSATDPENCRAVTGLIETELSVE